MIDLTEQESIILGLVEQGVKLKEIGSRLNVREQTVKNWVVIIRRKLGVTDRDVDTKDIRRLRAVAAAAGEALEGVKTQ